MLKINCSFPTLRCRSASVGVFVSPCVYNPPAGSFRCLNSSPGLRLAITGGFNSIKPVSPSESLQRLLSGGGGDELLESGAELVGFSHGWVALFNKLNNDLFLADPICNRRIKLPQVDALPDPEFNLDLDGQWSVSKVILSSSPEEDDCRAMMTFGPGNRLAFCLPGRSSEWTPIGSLFFEHDHHFPLDLIAVVHEDLVYCSRRKVFASITAGYLDLRFLSFDHVDGHFDSMICVWDIQDPNHSKLVRSDTFLFPYNEDYKRMRGGGGGGGGGSRALVWLSENIEVLEKECVQIPHIVYAEQSDQLFVVVQFVRLMKEDGESPLGFVPNCKVKGINGVFPGKTFGFLVTRLVDREYGIFSGQLVEDLEGMSMFVGINHSYAISASEHGEVKPNSIYFTDSNRLKRVRCLYDSGVFDYATKTISAVEFEDHTKKKEMNVVGH